MEERNLPSLAMCVWFLRGYDERSVGPLPWQCAFTGVSVWVKFKDHSEKYKPRPVTRLSTRARARPERHAATARPAAPAPCFAGSAPPRSGYP